MKQSIHTIQQDIIGNVSFMVNSFNRSWGIERLDAAKQRKDLLFAWWYGWNFINDMCMWLARLNNTFYSKNWGSNLEQVFQVPLIPSNLKERLETLATTDDFDVLKNAILSLKQDLRSLIRTQQEKTRVEKMPLKTDVLAGILEYINKAKKGCRTQDILLTSYAVSELQAWTMQLLNLLEGHSAHEFNFADEIGDYYSQMGFPDLSKVLSCGDYDVILAAIGLFERKLVHFFQSQGTSLENVSTMEHVAMYLAHHYP